MHTIWFWQKLVQRRGLLVAIKIYNKIWADGQSVSFFVCKDFINILLKFNLPMWPQWPTQ